MRTGVYPIGSFGTYSMRLEQAGRSIAKEYEAAEIRSIDLATYEGVAASCLECLC